MENAIKKDPKEAFLDYCGYDNGRNIKLNDMVGMFSSLNKVKPEVAMKILDQFPECSRMASNLANVEIDAAAHASEYCDKSSRRNVETQIKIIDAFESQLQDPSLTFEEKEKINDHILEVSKLVDNADGRQQQTILAIFDKTVKGLLGLACIAMCVLVGGKINLPFSSNKAV